MPESGESPGGVPVVSYRGTELQPEKVIVDTDVLAAEIEDPPSVGITRKKMAALLDRGLNSILLGKTPPKSAMEWARITKYYIDIAKDLKLIDPATDLKDAGSPEERRAAFDRLKREADKAILSGE